MRKLEFKPNGVRLFVIDFEHYDDHVHTLSDRMYAVTKKRNLKPLQVLCGFVKNKKVKLNEWSIKTGSGFAEATYTLMDQSYTIKVEQLPRFGNDSVTSF